MKKITLTLIGASLLAGALYASGDHMGDHLHEGKIMNHTNSNGMPDQQIEKMKKYHEACLNKLNSESKTFQQNISSIQQEHIKLFTQDIDYGG
jgi:hypothetical protein